MSYVVPKVATTPNRLPEILYAFHETSVALTDEVAELNLRIHNR